MYRYGNLSD
jgi:hypothetical protein